MTFTVVSRAFKPFVPFVSVDVKFYNSLQVVFFFIFNIKVDFLYFLIKIVINQSPLYFSVINFHQCLICRTYPYHKKKIIHPSISNSNLTNNNNKHRNGK